MPDLISELDEARRSVAAGRLHGEHAHVVELRRRLRARAADAWEACTDPDRVRRWLLPLSGDLRLGGRFQLEGNAGGTITRCEPPHLLEVTWEFGETKPGTVTLELTAAGHEATELVLRHTVADDEHWSDFGPGAVGVGWELSISALAALTAGGGAAPSARDGLVGDADAGVAELTRRSATAWGAAHEAAGASASTARNAAQRTSDFYAPR